MIGPPPIELLVFTGEPIGKAYITLARLEGGRWQSRQLFTVTDFYNRDVQMSPDRRYLYVLSECTWLGDIVRGELTALSNYQQYYQCLFSPNGRHLFGHQLRIPVGEAGDFVLFSLPDNRPVVLAKGRAMNFGWYPDSRHVWYEQDQPEQGRNKGVKPSRFFYQIDTYTGKQKKLSAQEVRRLNTDWYLLNRRFRVGGVGSTRGHAYSRNGQVRLVVSDEEVYDTSKRKKRQQVVVQWRDGRQRIALSAEQHQWDDIFGLDVSNDGRWALLSCSNEYRSFPGYRYIDRVIVVETATGRQFTAFELDGHRVGDFYVMHTMGRGFLFGVCQFA
jgi:hypothetical protein